MELLARLRHAPARPQAAARSRRAAEGRRRRTQLIGKTMPDGTTLTTENLDAWIRPQLPTQGIAAERRGRARSGTGTRRPARTPPSALYLGEPEDKSLAGLLERQDRDERRRAPGPDARRHRSSARPPDDPASTRQRAPGVPAAAPALRQAAAVLAATGTPARRTSARRGDSREVDADGVPTRGPAARTASARAERADGAAKLQHRRRSSGIGQVTRRPTHAIRTARSSRSPGHVDASSTATSRCEPLAIRGEHRRLRRGDAGQRAQTDAAVRAFSKINMHIHHVQFDTQASDGVISGMSFEQAVRPVQGRGRPADRGRRGR